jgi:hypothetical protein
MSETTKITTSKSHRGGQSCIIGEIIVKFDENLEAIVDTADLETLIAQDSSLSYEGMPKEIIEVATIKEEVTEEVDNSHVDSFTAELDAANGGTIEENPEKVNIVTGEVVEATSVEDDTIDDVDLSDLTLAALKETAKEAELPSSEWKSLKKDDLVAYLKTKI